MEGLSRVHQQLEDLLVRSEEDRPLWDPYHVPRDEDRMILEAAQFGQIPRDVAGESQLPDEVVEDFGHTDIEGYLRHYHDRVVCAAIEESKETVFAQTEMALERVLSGDWEAAKNDLLHAVHLFEHVYGKEEDEEEERDTTGLRASGLRRTPVDGSALPPPATPGASFLSGAARTPAAMSTPGFDVSAVRPVFGEGFQVTYATERYARVLQDWGAHPARETFPILAALSTAASDVAARAHDSDEAAQYDVTRVWRLLERQVQEGNTGIRAGCFREDYRARSPTLQAHLAAGSVAYLEESMLWIIMHELKQQPAVIRRGMHVSAAPVLEYINLRHAELSEGNPACLTPEWRGAPLWMHAFFLLRCGHWDDVGQLLEEYAASLPESTDRNLIHATRTALFCLGELALAFRTGGRTQTEARDAALRRCQSREVVDAVGLCQRAVEVEAGEAEQNRSFDPFRLAVLNLAGQWRMSLATEMDSDILLGDVKDYIWHGLLFLVGAPLADAHAAATRSRAPPTSLWDIVADVCCEWGWAALDEQNAHPYRFAEVLLLCQQYEEAVDYLVSHGDRTSPHTFLQDGTHLALSCYHFGLLRTCDTPFLEWGPPEAAGPILDPLDGDGLCLVRSELRHGPGSEVARERQHSTEGEEQQRPLTVNALRLPFLLVHHVHRCLGIPVPGADAPPASADPFGLPGIENLASQQEREEVQQAIERARPAHLCRAAEYFAFLDRPEDSVSRRRLLRAFVCLDIKAQEVLLGLLSPSLLPEGGHLLRREAPLMAEDELRHVVEEAGWQCCEEGRTLEGMQLFCRTSAAGKVLDIINDELRRTLDPTAPVTQPQGAWSDYRKQWQSHAAAFLASPLSREDARGARSAAEARLILAAQQAEPARHSFAERLQACETLLRLHEAFDDIHARHYARAIDALDRIHVLGRFDLVPRRPGPDAWRGFQEAPLPVQKAYGVVLQGALESLKRVHDQARSAGNSDLAASCRDRIALIATMNHPKLAQVMDPETAARIAQFNHGVA